MPQSTLNWNYGVQPIFNASKIPIWKKKSTISQMQEKIYHFSAFNNSHDQFLYRVHTIKPYTLYLYRSNLTVRLVNIYKHATSAHPMLTLHLAQVADRWKTSISKNPFCMCLLFKCPKNCTNELNIFSLFQFLLQRYKNEWTLKWKICADHSVIYVLLPTPQEQVNTAVIIE